MWRCVFEANPFPFRFFLKRLTLVWYIPHEPSNLQTKSHKTSVGTVHLAVEESSDTTPRIRIVTETARSDPTIY